MTIEEAFGVVIRRLRRERNFSQDKLSSSSSLDRAFISKIEGGKQQPSLVTIFELANALNVTASNIMVEVEFILKINCPDIFRPGHEKGKIDWISSLEKIMTEKSNDYKGSETILIADDEKQLRDMLASFLVNYGYKVILAEDGQEAIEKYKQHIGIVNLIIMDVVMPRKDGISTYKEIKGLQPDVIIFLTSGYQSNYLSKSDDFQIIQKPFSPVEIIKRIRTALDGNNCPLIE